MKTLFLLLCFVFLVACEENTTTLCGVENPLEELAFLKEAKNTIDVIDCAGKSSITQYTYKSQTVFEVSICGSITDGETVVYNCSGAIICEFGGLAGKNTCPDFESERANKISLYGN